jgi:hypothetical protein
LLSVVEPKKEMVWSDLYPSWSLTVYRVECTGSLSTSAPVSYWGGAPPGQYSGCCQLVQL